MKDYSFGDILLLKFPFSDGANFKKRPALVISDFGDDDILVCRITSQPVSAHYVIIVKNWKQIGLLLPSVARVAKLATLDKLLIEKKLGSIDENLKSKLKIYFLK